MARDQISPELALVDPGLALWDTKEAHPMMDSLDSGYSIPQMGTNPPTPAAAAANTPGPSVETLLFNAGLISADQLGELVRDAVVTQRPVAAIALERGLVTAETMAALNANAGMGVSPTPSNGAEAPAPVGIGGSPGTPSQAPAPTWPEPIRLSEPTVDAGATTAMAPPEHPVVAAAQEPVATVAPEPLRALAVEPQPAAPAARPEPLKSLDERVKAVVALAAQTPPAATSVEPETAAPSDARPAATTAGFAILVHLRNGERLTADTAATFEHAVHVARSLAREVARGDEWPLIAGRCIRPEAVVSVDIERALER